MRSVLRHHLVVGTVDDTWQSDETDMERYKVTFTYSEPTYAQARGIDEVSYVGVFEVTAADPPGAIVLATELFHEAQRSSSVSWAREIQTTTCQALALEQRIG